MCRIKFDSPGFWGSEREGGSTEGAEAVFLNRDRKRRRERWLHLGSELGVAISPPGQARNNSIIILSVNLEYSEAKLGSRPPVGVSGAVNEEGVRGWVLVLHIQFNFNFIPNSPGWGGGRQLVT